MKIAFLNYYQTGVSRGLETFISELSGRLAKQNQVLILPSPMVTKPASRDLSFLRRFFLDSTSLKIAFWTMKSLVQLDQFRPEIVFSQNGGWQALIISLYCRLRRSKMVIVGQSGPGWDDRWNLFVKPHLFVCLTQRQLDWARSATIWKQEFILIPNGVDLDQFGLAGKKVKLVLEKPIVMIVAASTTDKRVEQGIQAVAGLGSGSLLLLGEGPLDKRINKLGSELLGSKRFLHLSVKHREMADYYRSADVFTLCSVTSEAFGIVYLEAMASGLSCVATDDLSRREIIGNAGVFVADPNNIAQYTKAIKMALKKKWDQIPRQQAEKFSWDKIVSKYQEKLKNL